MSIHKSLKIAGAMSRSRNVFTRAERLEKLKEQGRWSEDQSIYGLPKVRTSTGKKKKKVVEDPNAEGAEGAEGEEAAEAADAT